MVLNYCWCTPAVIHWSPMAITFCVSQHAMFLFSAKLDSMNNVKGVTTPANKRKPQTAFHFAETKIPCTWRAITRMRKCFDRCFQSILVYYLCWYFLDCASYWSSFASHRIQFSKLLDYPKYVDISLLFKMWRHKLEVV